MLSQDGYIEKLIEKYNMSDCRTLETPLDIISKPSNIDSPERGGKEYEEMQSCDYRGIEGCRMFKLPGVDYQTRYC